MSLGMVSALGWLETLHFCSARPRWRGGQELFVQQPLPGASDPEGHFPPSAWALFSHFSSPLGHILFMWGCFWSQGVIPSQHTACPPTGTLSLWGTHDPSAGTGWPQPLRTAGSAGPTGTGLPALPQRPAPARSLSGRGWCWGRELAREAEHLEAATVERERRDRAQE